MKSNPHYAGDRSAAFWKRIRSYEDDAIYELGCVLQDVEGRVLAAMDRADISKPRYLAKVQMIKRQPFARRDK
jgi:hypothetical protein